MEPVFTPLASTLKAWMALMGWRLLVQGEERIPETGPLVVVSNHVSYLDPIQVGWVLDRCGRVPRFLAKRELFSHRLLGPLMRNLEQVPVDREEDPGRAVGGALTLLERGEAVVAFPEGTISTSFVPAERPKTGAARLALASGAAIVPIGLWGGQRILTKRRPRNLQRGVALLSVVGDPVPYEPGEDPCAVTERLWGRVGELVEIAQRRYPQQPAGPEDRWWLPAHLGGSAPTVEEAAALRRREAEERARRRAEQQTRARRRRTAR